MKGVVLDGTASGVGKTVDGHARFAFDVVRGDGIADEQDGLTEYRTLDRYAHVHAESGDFDAFLDNL